MEVVAKHGKNRKRKRHAKNKRRDLTRLEVRLAKRRRHVSERNVFVPINKLIAGTMEADAFWENYTMAQEWQRRHSVTWWRTRCLALEHENRILRDKIRRLAHNGRWQRRRNASQVDVGGTEEEEEEADDDDDDLEFHVNEDMMHFLEQSIRHKMEMRQQRESESATEREVCERQVPLEGGAAWMTARTEGARLLYGEASPRILAMETALQATMDRHRDRTKPQYWPNIPLNLSYDEEASSGSSNL